jgi:sugar O-acyltransferase (sialic acid O-acetyltransferase NeuD family)
MKKKIVLFGAGGHAVSCIDVIEEENKYKIECIFDKNSKNKSFKNYKVIQENEKNIQSILNKKIHNVLISIGQVKTSQIRNNLFKKLKGKGFKFPVIKSPKSIISKRASIDEGTIIFHNSVINAGAQIGKNCIINSSSLIEHGAKIGDNSHIATGAIINGDCEVANNSFVGSGSVLKQGLKLKKNSFIKMGSVVKK